MRKDFSSVLLGVYQNGKLYKNPIHPMTILENDYLVIISDGDHSDKLKEAFGVEEGRF